MKKKIIIMGWGITIIGAVGFIINLFDFSVGFTYIILMFLGWGIREFDNLSRRVVMFFCMGTIVVMIIGFFLPEYHIGKGMLFPKQDNLSLFDLRRIIIVLIYAVGYWFLSRPEVKILFANVQKPPIPENNVIDLAKLGLNDRQIATLKLMINERKTFSQQEYCKQFDVNSQTFKDDMQILSKLGLVIFEGNKYKAK